MENINMGIVNLVVSKKLNDAYFNNTLIEESKQLTNDFFDIVKNSPILQLEFKVFNNIENKQIENDLAATRYIDNNIKLFEVWTLKEIEKEHEKLKPFLTEDIKINDKKVNLYIAIGNLIKESLSNSDDIDVDNIHESFTLVLNHVKNTKKNIIESVEMINDDVIEIAVNKFNEKYESLNENDKNLFYELIKSSDEEKLELLEKYKSENLVLLEGINKDGANEKIAKAIQKIKEMSYKLNSSEFLNRIDDDIIGLHELKKSIL
jgi:hypothetical protein